MDNKIMGLREQIAVAKSELEVKGLLHKGMYYTQASDKTERRWHRTASKRTTELRRVPDIQEMNKALKETIKKEENE